MDNPGDNTRDIHREHLLELIEFNVPISGIALMKVGTKTLNKLHRSVDRGVADGGWYTTYQIITEYKWGLEGKLPRWVVFEIVALAREELSDYYRLVRQQRNHPTNATTRRNPANRT